MSMFDVTAGNHALETRLAPGYAPARPPARQPACVHVVSCSLVLCMSRHAMSCYVVQNKSRDKKQTWSSPHTSRSTGQTGRTGRVNYMYMYIHPSPCVNPEHGLEHATRSITRRGTANTHTYIHIERLASPDAVAGSCRTRGVVVNGETGGGSICRGRVRGCESGMCDRGPIFSARVCLSACVGQRRQQGRGQLRAARGLSWSTWSTCKPGPESESELHVVMNPGSASHKESEPDPERAAAIIVLFCEEVPNGQLHTRGYMYIRCGFVVRGK